MPPLELRKCMLVCIPGGHCREERNTAAQTQPTPVKYIEKIFLNYLWSILVGTTSESSSQVYILSSNMDGRRGLFNLVWRYTRVWMAALFSVNSLWVL